MQYALPVEQALAEHTCIGDAPVVVNCSGFDAHAMQCPTSVCSAFCGMAALVYDQADGDYGSTQPSTAMLLGLAALAGVLLIGLMTCGGVLVCARWLWGRPRRHKSLAIINDGRSYDALDASTPTRADKQAGYVVVVSVCCTTTIPHGRGPLATAKSIKAPSLQPLALHSVMEEAGSSGEGMVEVVLSPAQVVEESPSTHHEGVELISAFRKDNNTPL